MSDRRGQQVSIHREEGRKLSEWHLRVAADQYEGLTDDAVARKVTDKFYPLREHDTRQRGLFREGVRDTLAARNWERKRQESST